MNHEWTMSTVTYQTRGRLTIVIAIFLALTANFACEKASDDSKKPKNDLIPGLPSLTDAIPYEKLGLGKLVFERLGPEENNYSGVYVIDVSTRSSWGIGSGVFDGPAVSPNGQKIAFTRLASFQTVFDVHVMEIHGSNIQNVSFIEEQDRSPSWMPDSSQILFWIDLLEPSLYRQSPVASPADRTLIKTFSMEGNKLWELEGPVSVSKDLKLAFTACFSLSPAGIYTMDIDGSNLRKIVSMDSDSGSPLSPAWSPDGQKIAYLKYLRDFQDNFASLEIMVINADGRNHRSLKKFEILNVSGSYAGTNDVSLCWSPDGSKIAFNKRDEGYLVSHIYIINADGSGLTKVTFAEGVTDRSLSWAN